VAPTGALQGVAVSERKSGIKSRVISEAKFLFILFLYLFLLLGAFTAYRTLILAEYNVTYLFHFGANLVEAFLLAKVISLGRFLRLGERFRDRALIVPTMYKTVCFSIFAVVFFVVEEIVVGWLHGKAASAVLQEIFSQTIWGILAKALVLFMALAPLFAIWETGRVVGENTLFSWFFKRYSATDAEGRPRKFGT
jgi:hypothetical protein